MSNAVFGVRHACTGMGKALSVTASDMEDGGTVVQWTNKSKPGQHFRLG